MIANLLADGVDVDVPRDLRSRQQQFAGTAKDGQWVAVEPVLKSPDDIYK